MDTLIDQIELLSLSDDSVRRVKRGKRKAGVVMLRWNAGRKALQILLLKGKNCWKKIGGSDGCDVYTYKQPCEDERNLWNLQIGRWGPPKGGVESYDNSDADTARRELREETGYSMEDFDAEVLTSIQVSCKNVFLLAVAKKWVRINDLKLEESEIYAARWQDVDLWIEDTSKKTNMYNRVSRLLSKDPYLLKQIEELQKINT